jgi:hypothetical protein
MKDVSKNINDKKKIFFNRSERKRFAIIYTQQSTIDKSFQTSVAGPTVYCSVYFPNSDYSTNVQYALGLFDF